MRRSLLFVAAVLALASRGFAQASLEPSVPGTPAPGIPGGVSAMVEWDPDGAGPQPTKVYVGGWFDSAGNTLANNIAAWNGTDWEPLGAGVNGPVNALCVHNGVLYVGGRFSIAGSDVYSQNLAKWTGTTWQNASPGMTAPPDYYNQVMCLASFGDSLYAGGSFDSVGGYNARGIVRFTPSGISTLGTGLTRATYPPIVNCLQLWQGGLMIGGSFDHSGVLPANNIARWTGTTWASTGVGVDDDCDQFALYGSNMIILTGFGDLVQVDGLNTYSSIAPPGIASSARTYTLSNNLIGTLYVGGNYQLTPGGPTTYLYRWTGSSWVEAAPGLTTVPSVIFNTSGYLYATSYYMNNAGGTPVSGIARWNGSAWSRMGPVGGLNGDVWNSTKVRETDTLWITGNFTSNAGTPLNHVARWNGTTWAAAGAGLDRGASSLIPFNGSVVALGYNLSSGGTPLGHLAQWNGSSWVSIPSEITDPPSGSGAQLRCAVQWGNRLVVGGFFGSIGGVTAHNIAAWDGTTWHALGAGVDSFGPYTLAVYRGDIVAAGDFYNAGNAPALNIARWDGVAWHAMGSGISDDPPSWANSAESMAVHNGELYVAGNFGNAGGTACRNIAKWNGTSWSALGAGVGGNNDIVWSLTSMGGAVYASGDFQDALFSVHGRIYVWDGSTWNDAGGGDMGSAVYTITEHHGEIFAGGPFGAVQGRVSTFGTRMKGAGVTTPANGMAGTPTDFQVFNGLVYACSQATGADNFKVWNGSAFVPVPSQPSINGNGYQFALYTPPGQVQRMILSGAFSAAGPNAVANITGWQWPVVGTPWSTIGAGLGVLGNGGATAMLEYSGNLYASGPFSTPVGHFARWNGSAWTTLPPLDNWANDFAAYQGQLIAAGNFTTAGGQPMNYVARWNGSAWSPMGAGLTQGSATFFSAASALAVYNNELYVGGNFAVQGGVNSPSIAKWNGTSWSSVGGGLGVGQTSLGYNTSVSALSVYNGTLVVGGLFDSVGPAASPTSANCIATWDGSQWSRFTSGPLGSNGSSFGVTSVTALEANGCDLFIGGNFSSFNGVATTSAARYNPNPVPPIVLQPQDVMQSCVGSTVAFQLTHQPVGCYPVNYQWKRNGVPIGNGITPWGSFVSGATSSRIQIVSAQSQDQGQYTCLVSSSAGSESTDPATLYFPCVGCDSIDFNHDDLFPDTDDIATFIQVFGGGACPTGTCGDIDYNNDGLFPDTDDIASFIRVFGGGSCQ